LTTTCATGQITIPDIGTFTANPDGSSLLYKADRNGNVLWAVQIEPTGPGATSFVVDAKLNAEGKSVWIGGAFRGTVTLPGLPPLVGYPNYYTSYVIKFDTATGAAVGAMRFYCTDRTGGSAYIRLS
jgi:hypothetical protein